MSKVSEDQAAPATCICPDVVIHLPENRWEARYRNLDCPAHGEEMAADYGIQRTSKDSGGPLIASS